MPATVAPQPTPSAGTASPSPFDVFVSYCPSDPSDKQWVTEQLMPRLLKASLKVAISDKLVLGAPRLLNVQNAIRDSRFTVAVITPAWINDRWARYTRIGALTAGVMDGRNHFVPLKVLACELPEEMQDPFAADFTDPTALEATWELLLKHLAPSAVIASLRTLAELLKEPFVRLLLGNQLGQYQLVMKQMRILGANKRVHDLLHQLQMHCYGPLVVASATFPDETTLSAVQDYATALEELRDKLKVTEDRELFTVNEVRWVSRLSAAQEALATALECEDRKSLETAKTLLKEPIVREQGKVNTRLSTLAGVLDLAGLAQSMGTLAQGMRDQNVAGSEGSVPAQFDQAGAALKALKRRLARLRELHDTWQEVEDLLRATESSLPAGGDAMPALEDAWEQLGLLTRPLFASEVSAAILTFQTEGEKLDHALKAHDPFKARQAFRRYRGQAKQLFYETDRELLALCDDIGQVGEYLKRVVDPLNLPT